MYERDFSRHLIADFWDADCLAEFSVIEKSIREAVALAGSTLLQLHLHHFGHGNGVTGVALLAESHLSLHTWPERGYVALDVFMCGHADPYKAVERLRTLFQPAKATVRLIERGAPTSADRFVRADNCCFCG